MAKQSVTPLSLDPVVARIDLSAVQRQLTTLSQVNMSDEEWSAAEIEYRQFLTLRHRYPGRLLIPTGRCLAVWQAHILDTRAYRADCESVFGRYVDHFPYFGQLDPVDKREHAQAVGDYAELQWRHFPSQLPVGSRAISPVSDSDCEPGATSGARRRIILVALPWLSGKHQAIPLGHASILARLKGEPALEVRDIVRPVDGSEFPTQTLVAEIMGMAQGFDKPKVDIAFGVYVWNDKEIKDTVLGLRACGFSGRIILGGPQITYADAGLEALYPEVDVFIRGAGEEALSALCCNDSNANIPGVHLVGTMDRLKQAETSFQNLPSPWLTGVLDAGAGKSVHWESQRGCIFRCSFCQHRQPDSRAPIASANEDRVAREIKLLSVTRVQRISVLDPIFNRDENHAARILGQFIEHGYSGEISLQCRAELIDLKRPAFLDAAEKLNVTLEFGLQSVVEREFRAIGRPNNLPKVEAVLDEVRRRGIRHEVSLIYGLPEQTVGSFQTSVDWCMQRRIPVVRAFPLLLLRGTELFHERSKWKLTVREGLLPVVISSSTFDEPDWQAMDAIANALVATEGKHPLSLNDLRLGQHVSITAKDESQYRALGRLQ